MIFAVLGDIGDVGRKISLERDWIVVMCDDKYELTGINIFAFLINLKEGDFAIYLGQLDGHGLDMRLYICRI